MPLEANFKKQIPNRGLLTFFTQYDDALQNFSFSQNNVKNLSMILTTHSAEKKKKIVPTMHKLGMKRSKRTKDHLRESAMKQPRLWNRELQGGFTEGLAEDLKQELEMPRVGSTTLQAVAQRV